MNCPYCAAPGYRAGRSCDACGWEPHAPEVSEAARERRVEAEREADRAAQATTNANLLAAGLFLAGLLVVFWVVPASRRGSDWFSLTQGEVISAVVMATVGWFALARRGDDDEDDLEWPDP